MRVFDSQLLLTYSFSMSMIVSFVLTKFCLFSVTIRTRSSDAVKFFYRKRQTNLVVSFVFSEILDWHHRHAVVRPHNYSLVRFDIVRIHVEFEHYILKSSFSLREECPFVSVDFQDSENIPINKHTDTVSNPYLYSIIFAL